MNVLIWSVIFTHSFTSVWSLGLSFHCPDTFEMGEENLLKCIVNTTAIKEADCYKTPHTVTFALKTPPLERLLCQHPYDPDKPCISEAQHNTGDCWCSHSEGEIFTYILSYPSIIDPAKHGELECSLCFLPKKPLDLYVDESCLNVSLEKPLNLDIYQPKDILGAIIKANVKATIGGTIGGIIVVIIGNIVIRIIIIFMRYLFKKNPKLPGLLDRIFFVRRSKSQKENVCTCHLSMSLKSRMRGFTD